MCYDQTSSPGVRMHLSLALLPFVVCLGRAIELGDDINFQLDLIKHQPCNRGANAKWTKKLEFESGTDKVGPKLEPIPNRPNCYTIGGKVDVLEDFRGEFSIYLELRNTASKKQVPESCVKQNADGCGGFGSCLYCNACKTFGDNVGVQAQLLLDGNPIKCSDGLNKGTYDNLKLAFCLPKMEDILHTQGLTKETFLQLIRNDDTQTVQKMGIFATVYIFDTDVSKQMQTQARIESVYRKTKKSFFKFDVTASANSFIPRATATLPFIVTPIAVKSQQLNQSSEWIILHMNADEPLPADVYWSLPFNMMIKNQQIIYIIATIVEKSAVDHLFWCELNTTKSERNRAKDLAERRGRHCFSNREKLFLVH
ncbi:hypothetical protein Q1695_000471 [Nippostrongylus brasiliensis]|nr:hypothetical protein Q1695_000471 [Nippostrongylus brasiliensis]